MAQKNKRPRPLSSPDGLGKSKDQRFTGLDFLPAIQQMLDAQAGKNWNKFQQEIRGLEDRITAKIEDVVNSVNFNAKDIEEIKKETIPNIKKRMENERRELEDEIDRLSSYICRENLVFMGIPEKEPKDGDQDGEAKGDKAKEKVIKELQEFYVNHLKMEPGQISAIAYQRVHRVASVMRPRPIKARFVHYSDRELVMKNSKQLKGTKMYISQDLPRRIRLQRKRQIDALREARSAGKLAYFSNLEPGKLYVDRVYLPIDKQAEFIEKCQRSSHASDPVHVPLPQTMDIGGAAAEM